MRQPYLGVVALLAGATAASAGTGGEPWDGTPFEAPAATVARAARSVTPQPDSPVNVLLAETELRYELDGRCVRRDRLVYRVESQEGRDSWNAIEAGWAPWHQARPEVRARVIAPDGREATLDPSTILEAGVDQTDEEVFSDRRQLSAPLPGLVVGSIVEHQTIVRDETPWFPAGVVSRLYLHRGGPVRVSRIVIDAPSSTRVRWSARLLPGLEPTRDEREGRVRLTFEGTDLPAFADAESGLPPDVSRWPHVAVSTGQSWTQVARAYSELVERQLGGADVSALVKEAGGSAGERRAVIQRLLGRLDAIRYTSVQLGDAAFVPRTPREVLARGYGDCKDKATLLVALLRSAGISASVALLSSGYDEDVPEDLPGMGLFNHAIVHVPGPPEMWIDATVERFRAGEFPLNDQGRRALVASPDTQRLVLTPETTAAENGTVETREFHLGEMGPARVVETTEYRGAYDRHFRRQLAGGDAARRRGEYEDYVRREYLAESLGALDEGRAEDLDQAFRVKVEAVRARRGLTDEREGVVAYFPGRVANDLPQALAPPEEGKDTEPARESPFYFATPHFVEHRYRIVPPPGFAIRDLPPPEDLAVGPARYTAVWKEEGAVVSGTIRFETGPRRISAEQFRELRDALRTLRARPAALVRFAQVGEAYLAEGRVREALGEFDALARKHPQEALHRTQRALALLRGGMGEAAREEARRAVAVEPASAVAHRRLGWVLQHDLVGRRFARGADLSGALAAYRKAVELAPEDAPTRSNLAYLLEFNDQGEQYGPGAKLGEAAEQYWHLARKNGQAYSNLPLVLLRAGRHAELMEAARLLEGDERARFEVLAAAAQDGVKAGVARAGRIAQAEERRRALEEAADQLLRVRRYADAAALLEEAAQGSPNASAVRGRAELLARVRRHERSDAIEPGPEGLVRTFIHGLLLGWDDERLLGLFHREERDRQAAESLREPLAPVRALFDRERRKVLLPAEVFADLTLSSVELATEGDDRYGYRIRLRNPQAGMQVLYVVKEGDRYSILGSSANPETLADEALRRVGANDIEGARRMLDWAREELSASGDDPFAGPQLPHLWSVGQPGGADAVRLASASLLVLQRASAEQGVQILQAGRGIARDELERAHLDSAIQGGYATLGRWADALATSDRLAARLEASASLRAARAFSLHRLGRSAELRRSSEEWLRTHPGDLGASRSLRLALMDLKDFPAIEKLCQPLLESGRANANDHNDCAWNTLFLAPPRPPGIARARRGVEMSGARRERAYLHTLATLYASDDQATEAYGVMLEALKVGADEEPQPVDWFVFGRMAETYGLPDAAIKAYQRVTKGEYLPGSTWELAQERLAALDAAARRTSNRKARR